MQLISKSALFDSVLTSSLKERIYFHDNTAAGAGYLLPSVYSLKAKLSCRLKLCIYCRDDRLCFIFFD